MPTKYSTSLNLDKDFDIKPQPGGGFIISQTYHEPDYSQDSSDRQYYDFKRAFSSSADLIEFLNQAYNYPITSYREPPTHIIHPTPVAFTREEGGPWSQWPKHYAIGDVVHSIKFADDSILDLLTGWRMVP
jgi:hypothetical protein